MNAAELSFILENLSDDKASEILQTLNSISLELLKIGRHTLTVDSSLGHWMWRA